MKDGYEYWYFFFFIVVDGSEPLVGSESEKFSFKDHSNITFVEKSKLETGSVVKKYIYLMGPGPERLKPNP
jgi:hypothetical protein